jgi:DnaJ-class molecular chaperone
MQQAVSSLTCRSRLGRMVEEATKIMDLYQKLQVGRNATAREIRSAYRRRVQELHPDHLQGEDATRFREVQEAYDVLSDADARKAYDRRLGSEAAVRERAGSLFPEVYEVPPRHQGARETVREVTRMSPRNRSSYRDEGQSIVDPLGAEWERMLEWIFGRQY